MLLILNKHVVSKILLILAFLLALSLLMSSEIAAAEFNVKFKELIREEETRHRKIGKDKLLIMSYKNIIKKEFVNVENKTSSLVFSKVITCGNTVYPAILTETIEKDAPEEFHTRNLLIIYNESLEEIAYYPEHLDVSNEYTDSPDKFQVDSQPKFTLENVEAFVCSSQINICAAEEKLYRQCTFNDGRQANICDNNGDKRLKIGKSTTELDLNHLLTVNNGNGYGIIFDKYSNVIDSNNNALSGISDSASFHDNKGTDYAFENHWSTRSRDDYDFHAEFNIRKDGKIIESNRYLETSYD